MTTSTRPIFGTIAFLCFVSNGLLCAVILRNRKLLKNSYNVLVFTLAITDTLTGIFLGISPVFVLGNENVPIPAGSAGDAFCKTLPSGYFLWVFAKFSVAIVTLMTVERWFAIARPTKYKTVFKTRRVVVYVTVLVLLSFLLTVQLIMENHLATKNGIRSCVYRSLITPKVAENTVNIIYCFVTVFLPLIFITATNVHLWKIMNNQISAGQGTNTRRHLELKLLRMSILVAVCIAICFVPNQISYILAMTLDSHPYSSPIHTTTVVLSMSNSCINPWIYCLTNNLYRKEFARLLCPCKRNRIRADSDTNSTARMAGSTAFTNDSRHAPRCVETL